MNCGPEFYVFLQNHRDFLGYLSKKSMYKTKTLHWQYYGHWIGKAELNSTCGALG